MCSCTAELGLIRMMDAMMSILMSRATSRLYPGSVAKTNDDDAPLDLRWAHTSLDCDRFVNQEDLRQEECLMSDDDSACSSPVAQSVCQQESPYVVPTDSPPRDRNPSPDNYHPFSIESIVGKQTLNSPVPEVTEPARVFRHHEGTSNRCDVYFQSFYETFSNGSFKGSVDGYSRNNDGPTSDGARGTHVFWCHVCNEFCTGKDDAIKHQISHRVRGSVAKLQRSLFQHHGYVTSHEYVISENSVTCGLCQKDVAYWFFSKHQQLHNGHVCDICHQEFSTNSRLQDHMNIHTGSTSFVCHVCDRKFAKKSSLTQHKRYHRDHQAFQCHFCQKHFNSKYACAVHERRHTGYNPYVCDIPGCKQAYPQKIQLQLHQNSHRHATV